MRRSVSGEAFGGAAKEESYTVEREMMSEDVAAAAAAPVGSASACEMDDCVECPLVEDRLAEWRWWLRLRASGEDAVLGLLEPAGGTGP